MDESADAVRNWWRTAIIEMAPGKIAIRGERIGDLIGHATFPQMIWLMVRGEMPSPEAAKLLEAALVAGVDHGPQAPSIAVARMAITCGVGLNNAMASAINMLGDVHGGAGEQCAELFYAIGGRLKEGAGLESAVAGELARWQQQRGKIIPGYGHRFHRQGDPRVPRLSEIVQQAVAAHVIEGQFQAIATEVESQLAQLARRRQPLNIDGVTAMIYCELGFATPLARGLFCLSRAVGILAHAWEQQQQGGRNKGPMPPQFLPAYIGSKSRLPSTADG